MYDVGSLGGFLARLRDGLYALTPNPCLYLFRLGTPLGTDLERGKAHCSVQKLTERVLALAEIGAEFFGCPKWFDGKRRCLFRRCSFQSRREGYRPAFWLCVTPCG